MKLLLLFTNKKESNESCTMFLDLENVYEWRDAQKTNIIIIQNLRMDCDLLYYDVSQKSSRCQDECHHLSSTPSSFFCLFDYTTYINIYEWVRPDRGTECEVFLWHRFSSCSVQQCVRRINYKLISLSLSRTVVTRSHE